MPGSGKGAFQRIFQRMGYPVVIMGDEVREEAKRINHTPTPENLGKIMIHLRESEGPAAIAKRCIPKLKKKTEKTVGIDGIRSLSEVKEFKKHFPKFVTIAIHASPQTRYERLSRRKRSDDPQNWETFSQRDQRELSVGMGDVIATADYMIVNEGSLNQLKRKIHQILKEELSE
jgi:dephospho-CoA kinase